MPSASKKRKAAKKKKERVATINPLPNSHTQGSDGFKSQDENPDHDDHYLSVNEGSEVEERDLSAAQSFVADMKSMEEVTSYIKSAEEVERKEDSVVEIERELKSEESSDSKNVNVECTLSAEESHYRNENSSGNSKDESLSEKNSKNDQPNNSIQGAMTTEYLVKSSDSSLAQITLVTENSPVKEIDNSVKVVSSVSEVKNSDTGNELLEKSVVAQVGLADLAIKRNDDKVYPFSDENVMTSSLEEPKPKEYDSKAPISSSGSPFTTTGQENVKDSESPECSENQPLMASTPPLVKKTSWLSCCGLFEVLSGSNR